jgi:hypothetical protein
MTPDGDDADPFMAVLRQWRRDEVDLLPPVEEAEVERFFREELGFPLTADVRRLYSMTGGLIGYDRHWYRLVWPLDYVLELNDHNETPHLWFADFWIESYLYSLEPVSAETSAVWVDFGDGGQWRVADSLAEFLHKSLADPESVEMIHAVSHPKPPGLLERMWSLLRST